MATYYGVNATNRDNSSIPKLEGVGEKKSPLLIAFDQFTMPSALVQNDIIKMMKLPSGARIHDVILGFSASLDASGGTLEVGWEANSVDAADADGFMDALDVTTSGGGIFEMADDKPQRPGNFKKFDALGGETQISLTVSHSGGLDLNSLTGQVISLAVHYTVS